MKGLDQLWAYQKVDMEIDKAEHELKVSPERQKLVRTRNFLVEQQNLIKSMTEAMADKQALVEKLLEAHGKLAEQAEEYERIVQDEKDFITKEELEQMRQEEIELLDGLKKCEKELNALSGEMQDQIAKLNDMRVKIAKAKKDYPVLKEKYDQAAAKIVEATRPLVDQRSEMAKTVPEELMARYKAVKKQRPMPVAKLVGDQCGGCFMNIAALVMQRVNEPDTIVVCENCGRILYPVEK